MLSGVTTPDPAATAPSVRIVRGAPTADEVAALVGALLLRPAPPAAAPPGAGGWSRSARPARAGGRTPWRLAARPR